jgi:hypothetical protein
MIKILLHFMSCYLIADITYNCLPFLMGNDEYWQPIIPKLIAISVSFAVGIGKELWDKYHDKESISGGDLTVDAIGALAWVFLPLITSLFPWK